MTCTSTPSGCMTPQTPSLEWCEKPMLVDAHETPRLPKALGSPAPLTRSYPTLPPTPPIYAIRPKLRSRVLAKSHAEKLKARLQLAYFRVKTNQINVPLNEITI